MRTYFKFFQKIYIPSSVIAGYQTVEAGSVDSLALHIAIVGAAILIGILLKKSLINLGRVFPSFRGNSMECILRIMAGTETFA